MAKHGTRTKPANLGSSSHVTKIGHHPSIPRGVSLKNAHQIKVGHLRSEKKTVQKLIVFHPCQPHSAILLHSKLFLFTYSKRKIQKRGGWYLVPSNDMIWGLLKSWGSRVTMAVSFGMVYHFGFGYPPMTRKPLWLYGIIQMVILALGTAPWGNLYGIHRMD